MITIKVIKNNEITNQATFETQELADSWLKKELDNKSFGEVSTFNIKVEYV